MSLRVGMIAALIAAALLALSATGLSWWSGNPTLDGKVFNRKTAHIGLINAKQCNFDDAKNEEYDCKHLSVGGSLAITKFIQLGLTGLAALSLLGLAFAGEKRRGLGKLALATVMASSVMAVIVLAMGPNLKTGKSEEMPLSVLWILAFSVGTLSAFISAVAALLPQRRPRPRISQPAAVIPAQQPAFDVQALLADDSLRPAALGPEPRMGKPQSPGGMLPGPAGPLVPPSGPQPLFSTAPQLRPLYEAGASGGFVPPAPQVQFPVRGPTPMPQAAVSAIVGMDAPPAPPAPPSPPPPAPNKIPPHMRPKPPSVAPPIPAIPLPPSGARKPPPPAKATITSAAVPPPTAADDPADRLSTVGYEKNLLATGDSTSPSGVAFDSSTAENATKEFQQEERTDVGDEVKTNAIDKVDPDDARPSKTEVEKVERKADEGQRLSTSVISSATPPPRLTPAPVKTTGANVKLPITTASTSLPPPAEASTGGPSPACPQCEAPMSWVEEHLRFYCKSCRMYF